MGRKYSFNLGILFFVFGVIVLLTGKALAQTVEVDIAAAGYEVSAPEEKALGLSNLQSQKKDALDKEFLAGQNILREEIRTKRDVLRQELLLETPDRMKLRTLAREILDAQGKIADNRIDYIFKLRDILTPEQWKSLHSMRAAFQANLKAKAQEHSKIKMKAGKAASFSVQGNVLPNPGEKK